MTIIYQKDGQGAFLKLILGAAARSAAVLSIIFQVF